MMITDHAALFGFIKWIDIFTRNKEFVYNKFQTITPQFNINILGFGAGYKYWLH